jgi:hypothetical protein
MLTSLDYVVRARRLKSVENQFEVQHPIFRPFQKPTLNQGACRFYSKVHKICGRNSVLRKKDFSPRPFGTQLQFLSLVQMRGSDGTRFHCPYFRVAGSYVESVCGAETGKDIAQIQEAQTRTFFLGALAEVVRVSKPLEGEGLIQTRGGLTLGVEVLIVPVSFSSGPVDGALFHTIARNFYGR